MKNEYDPHRLNFAYCYRVYFRWQTHRRRAYDPLKSLSKTVLANLVHQYKIEILECSVSANDIVVFASLRPHESISACAGKLKGRVSKWLKEELKLTEPTLLLSRGYFAYTTGPSSRKVIEKYLDDQGIHHGYVNRPDPPIFVGTFPELACENDRISPRHALVIAKFHIVLCTRYRREVFGAKEGERVTDEWRRQELSLKAKFLKVSFVPDHVHIAVRLHPEVSPAAVVAALMNIAQSVLEVMELWQMSAYIGSFGELTSAEISSYVRRVFADV